MSKRVDLEMNSIERDSYVAKSIVCVTENHRIEDSDWPIILREINRRQDLGKDLPILPDEARVLLQLV